MSSLLQVVEWEFNVLSNQNIIVFFCSELRTGVKVWLNFATSVMGTSALLKFLDIKFVSFDRGINIEQKRSSKNFCVINSLRNNF